MRQLRGTKAHHRQNADDNMQMATAAVRDAMQAIKEGNCTKAYMRVVNMWEAMGRADAHGHEAGQTAWLPVTEIQELGYQFSTRCLRDEPLTLGARRRRARCSK
jgi:hypothetical protein